MSEQRVDCPHEPHTYTCGFMDAQLYLCDQCRDHVVPIYLPVLMKVWDTAMDREFATRREHDAEVAALGESIDLLEAELASAAVRGDK